MKKQTTSEPVPFKEKVRDVIASVAPLYESYFLRYDYLLCSPAFTRKPYYIVSAVGNNFEHLSGVSSDLSATEFYEKARAGVLSVNDFNIDRRCETDKDAKGSIRRKIQVLPYITDIFTANSAILAEEDFVRNRVI